MRAAIERWRDRLGLGLLAAMAFVPFLHPRHLNPIPSFWSEWWAVALGIAAAGVLLSRPSAWEPMHIPRIVLLPLLFCAAALIQIALHRAQSPQQALLYAAMLLWAALMVLLGRHLRDRFGQERIVDLVAAALLVGALANTVVSVLQWQQATAFADGWLFPRLPGYPPYGNVGQGNHLNHEMWIGVLSAFYLHLRGRLGLRLLWAGLVPMLLAASLTGSRSIFLYAAAMPLLAWPWRRLGEGQPDWRRWLRLTAGLVPAVLVLQWLVKKLPEWVTWLSGLRLFGIEAMSSGQDLIVGTASERLFHEVSGTGIRLRLYAAAVREFLEAPWLGNGVGSFPWRLFLSNDEVPADWAPGVAEHAHNIVLHWLVEFGLPTTLLALALLALWARRFFAGRWTLQHLWLAGMLGITALHSLLEYPLWYAYFLGLAALILGLCDNDGLEVPSGRRGAVLAAVIALGALPPLAMLRSDYAALETMLNRRHTTATMRSSADELVRLQRDSLLAPHALVTLAVTMDPAPLQLDAKNAVCGTAQRFAPAAQIVFKCAVLLQLEGRSAEAATQMRRALRAFPEERAQVAKELQPLAARDARLAPMAAMAAAD